MIESFEKTKPQTITTNCNNYRPHINQIVRIEAKDDRGNVVFSINGGDITISVEKEQLGYHYL